MKDLLALERFALCLCMAVAHQYQFCYGQSVAFFASKPRSNFPVTKGDITVYPTVTSVPGTVIDPSVHLLAHNASPSRKFSTNAYTIRKGGTGRTSIRIPFLSWYVKEPPGISSSNFSCLQFRIARRLSGHVQQQRVSSARVFEVLRNYCSASP